MTAALTIAALLFYGAAFALTDRDRFALSWLAWALGMACSLSLIVVGIG